MTYDTKDLVLALVVLALLMIGAAWGHHVISYSLY